MSHPRKRTSKVVIIVVEDDKSSWRLACKQGNLTNHSTLRQHFVRGYRFLECIVSPLLSGRRV
jgi:hypothetical protein